MGMGDTPTRRQADGEDGQSAAPFGFGGELVLGLSRLDAFGQITWLHFANELVALSGGRLTVSVPADQLVSGVHEYLGGRDGSERLSNLRVSSHATPLGAGDEFVFLTSAARLSAKLLTRFSCIHVVPTSAPDTIDGRMYWFWTAEGGYLEALSEILVDFAETDFSESFQRFRAAWSFAEPSVTIVSSVFDANEYLMPFLENMAQLKGYDDCEHFLVRPGSPGDEHDALLGHASENPGTVYVNMQRDPGLYETWNLCARLSNSRYLSNANIDDRRAPEHIETLSDRLNSDDVVDLASGALRVTTEKNIPWEESADCPVWYGPETPTRYAAENLVKQTPDGLVPHNIPHCMPVWRRSLHLTWGYFCESAFGPSADWEFWLRCGEGGARFGHVPEPLGLYLKAEDSYWQTHSGGEPYTRRILDRYGAPAGEGSGRLPDRESSNWPAPAELLREGALVELLASLMIASREIRHRDGSEAERERLDAVAGEYLGVSGFSQWAAEWSPEARQGTYRDDEFVRHVIELVRLQHPDRLGLGRAQLDMPAMSGVLADLYAMTRDLRALIVLAWLAGRTESRSGQEERLLREAHRIDPSAFWRQVQDVYRFEMPLEDFVRIVTPRIGTCSDSDVAQHSRQKIWFYPDFREGNAYQTLLYEPARNRGADVTGLADRREIAELTADDGRECIFHLHWEDALFKDAPPADVPMRMAEFLRQLRSLRRRGVRIYWTIHNAVGHEAKWVDTEIAFRKFLVRLVDRVYIQHPLVLDELEWLLAEAPVWLTEHGPYEGPKVEPENKESARKNLGLDDDDLVLLHFGRVKDYKDLHRYLPIIGDLMEEDSRLKLIIAGRIASRPVRETLKALPKDQVIVQDRFVKAEELQEFLEAADYSLLSYRAILTSGSLMHSFSAGVPVLAPELGTLPAYVVQGWNGFLYGDEADFEFLLRQRLADRAESIQILARNAARTASGLKWRFC